MYTQAYIYIYIYIYFFYTCIHIYSRIYIQMYQRFCSYIHTYMYTFARIHRPLLRICTGLSCKQEMIEKHVIPQKNPVLMNHRYAVHSATHCNTFQVQHIATHLMHHRCTPREGGRRNGWRQHTLTRCNTLYNT